MQKVISTEQKAFTVQMVSNGIITELDYNDDLSTFDRAKNYIDALAVNNDGAEYFVSEYFIRKTITKI